MPKTNSGKSEKIMRCKKHPKFDPQDDKQFEIHSEFRNCLVCCGLNDGTKRIGDYPGEYRASQSDIEEAKMIIGPMNLEKFGHVRSSLGYDYHMSDGPMWCVDEKTRTIYLEGVLDPSRLEEFRDKYKIKVRVRSWTEPKLKQVKVSANQKNVHCLRMRFGDSDTEISLCIKTGMTVKEVRQQVSEFLQNLDSIPNDGVKEESIRKSKT